MTTQETRREAFESVDITTGQREVLNLLAEHGKLAADQAAALMGRRESYVRPRVSELLKRGLIRTTGEKVKTATGKSQAVVEIAPPPKVEQKELF